jgi:ssDNA-binding Zn-finger/Zn-ribbon topoisomerase 1
MGDAADDAYDQVLFEMMDEDFGYMEEGYEPSQYTHRMNGDCPECGAKTVLRTGPYGKFKGCSRYPKCMGSYSI